MVTCPLVSSGGRDAAISLPYPLRDIAVFRGVHLLVPGKLVYTATHVPTQRRVCIKFTDSDCTDGADVHRAWAAHGLAPELLDGSPQQLPGGFSMLVMDYLRTSRQRTAGSAFFRCEIEKSRPV